MFGWETAVNLLLYAQCILTFKFVEGKSCKANLTPCSVSTSTGRIVGDCSYKPIYKYLSIPYARPPVGDLRLEDPVSFTQDSTTLVNGTRLPPKCPQQGASDESEDCLYLNIWAPCEPLLPQSRPVLFWIHGGSNYLGSGSDPTFDGTKFAEAEKVIIVTYNYRLGLLGFFDDGGSTNFAVKDTIKALEWVKKNIGKFGGNPNLITVFSNSSGGSIVRALMSSPSASGLFKRAILQSDAEAYGFNKRSVSNDKITSQFLNALDCADKACVKSKSVSDILQAQAQTLSLALTSGDLSINNAYPLGPVIDGALISADYSSLLSSGTLPNKVDLLIGFTTNEAGPTINSLFTTPMPSFVIQPALSQILGAVRAQTILDAPAYQLGNGADATREYLEQIATDYYWRCSIQHNIRSAILSHSSGNAYVYELKKGIQYPTNSPFALCSNGAICHQDDLYLTFGNFDQSTPDDLKALSREIQKTWVKFAKHGNFLKCGNSIWPKVSDQSLSVCNLGEGAVTQGNTDRCDIIDSIQYPFELYSS